MRPPVYSAKIRQHLRDRLGVKGGWVRGALIIDAVCLDPDNRERAFQSLSLQARLGFIEHRGEKGRREYRFVREPLMGTNAETTARRQKAKAEASARRAERVAERERKQAERARDQRDKRKKRAEEERAAQRRKELKALAALRGIQSPARGRTCAHDGG